MVISCFAQFSFLLLILQQGGYAMIFLENANPPSLGNKAAIGHSICAQNLEKKQANCSSRYLTEVPQDLFPDIVYLDLTGNNLQKLQTTCFQLYSNLEELCLNASNISFIASGTFHPLRRLKKLEIAHNPVVILIADKLRLPHELQNLNLVACELNVFHFKAVEQLRKLERLDLASNEITDINCSSIRMEKMVIDLTANNISKLTPENIAMDCLVSQLILMNNPIQVVDPETVASLEVRALLLGGYLLANESLKNLTWGVSQSVIERLSIISAGLTLIIPDNFEPLNNASLGYLSLAGNSLVLYPYVFANLRLLSELDLSNCNLLSLEPEYFYGMSALHTLTIFGNLFFSVNPFNSTWHVSLHELDIMIEVYYQEITLFTFQGLDNLTKLVLLFEHGGISNTEIELLNLEILQIYGGEFKNIILNTPRLKYLRRIPFPRLYHFGTVFQISASHLLEHVTLSRGAFFSDFKLQLDFMGYLPKLSYLDLSQNQLLGEIPNNTFRNMSSLQTLNLYQNEIYSIQEDAFSGLTLLKVLSLAGNELYYLSDFIFKDLKALTTLYLGWNQLTYLNKDIFADTPNLSTLSLIGNRFVGFSQSTFDPVYFSLKSVDISQNNLVCNCDSKWLVTELGKYLTSENKTLCSTSLDTLPALRGKPVMMFKPSKYCGLNVMIVLSITAVSLIISFISVICYHYRRILRYKLFLLKLAIRGYKEMYDALERQDFEYDVNMIFIDDDKEWGEEYLRPVLQQRLPNFRKIAFGDDNLVLGMHYFDAVYYNVQNSFKTVLILSRAAVQDHIFMTKFRIAMNHVTDTQIENMVLVFLEDIPDNELPYLVRLYMSGQGFYLRWNMHEEDQEYFWNKLTKHLSVHVNKS